MQHARNPLLRDDAPNVAVRVARGVAVRAIDDMAPSVSRLFWEGELIPNLELSEAVTLIAYGLVEEVS